MQSFVIKRFLREKERERERERAGRERFLFCAHFSYRCYLDRERELVDIYYIYTLFICFIYIYLLRQYKAVLFRDSLTRFSRPKNNFKRSRIDPIYSRCMS